MKYPIIIPITVLIVISVTVCGFGWIVINAQSQSVMPLQEIARNPSMYINQTVVVKGILSSVPMPRPTEFQLSSENRTDYLYVAWNSSDLLISQVNDTTAIVHGIVREEQWIAPNALPPNSVKMDIYFIEAEKVELLTKTP
jgi:hypothetical protein